MLTRSFVEKVIVVYDGSSNRTTEVAANAGVEIHTTNKGKVLKGETDIVNGSCYLNDHTTDMPEYRCIGQTILDKITIMNYDNCRRGVVHCNKKNMVAVINKLVK